MNRRFRGVIAADAPREPCPDCVRKHLGQAAALLQETLQGYPDHFWLAIGHLAEAEAEAQGKWPDLAEQLRDERKKMESDDYMPDIVSYIAEVTKRVTDEAVKERVARMGDGQDPWAERRITPDDLGWGSGTTFIYIVESGLLLTDRNTVTHSRLMMRPNNLRKIRRSLPKLERMTDDQMIDYLLERGNMIYGRTSDGHLATWDRAPLSEVKKVIRKLGEDIIEIHQTREKKLVAFRVAMRIALEAATKVDRTEVGSKLDFRLTYPSGSKKWTDDRPGDGRDPDRGDYLEGLFSRGDVKRGLKALEKAVAGYVSSGKSKPIKDAVDKMVVDAGSDVTKDVIRRVYKVEKAQLDEKKAVEGQKKAVEGLGVAKDRVNEKTASRGRVAKKYGHTLWIDPRGKVIDLGNGDMHYNWIAKNWDELFPDVEMTDKGVFEVPEERGWLRVRNHTFGFGVPTLAITGQKRYVKKRGDLLMDLVIQGLEQAREKGDELFVDIYDGNRRTSYVIPEDLDDLMRVM
jgi:hypothetical protein